MCGELPGVLSKVCLWSTETDRKCTETRPSVSSSWTFLCCVSCIGPLRLIDALHDIIRLNVFRKDDGFVM